MLVEIQSLTVEEYRCLGDSKLDGSLRERGSILSISI